VTSTNHFRNRRLAGSARALVKHCKCPPAPASVPVVDTGYAVSCNFSMTDSGHTYACVQSPTPMIRNSHREWYTWITLTDTNPASLKLVWTFDNSAAFIVLSALALGDWTGLGSVDFGSPTPPYPFDSGQVDIGWDVGSGTGWIKLVAQHAFHFPPING
jgi:hypothetical protein